MKRTKFVKNQPKNFFVTGTLPSIHNGLLLVSTGIPTLDDLLGGGLPVGSVFMVEEDVHCRFSKVVTRYFLAEGVMSQHGLFIVPTKKDSTKLLDSLPKPLSSLTKQDKSIDSQEMKIAFNYKNLPQDTTTLSDISKYGHYYDISSVMDRNLIANCHTKVVSYDFNSLEYKDNRFFKYTLNVLNAFLKENNQYHPPDSLNKDTAINVLRVAIPNFGSPLWCNNNALNTKHCSLFLHTLRALARQSMFVCLLTVPTHLYAKYQVAVLRQLVDCSIQLDAFVGEKHPAFGQYHGIIKIRKLPCVNSLLPCYPKSFDLAFELKRNKFIIECFHLPPDLSETVSRQGMDETNKYSGLKRNKNLDF